MKLMKWYTLNEKRPDYNRRVLVMYEVENGNNQTFTVTSPAKTHNAEAYYEKFIEEDIANGNDDDLEVDKYLLSKIQDGTDDPLRFTIINCDGEEMADDILADEVLLWAYEFEDTDVISFEDRLTWCIFRLNKLGFKVRLKKYEREHYTPFNDFHILFEFSYDALADICNVVPLQGSWTILEPVNDHAVIMCNITNDNELEKALIDLDTWIDGLEEHFHN